jgi:hypothetical protein
MFSLRSLNFLSINNFLVAAQFHTQLDLLGSGKALN